MPSDGTSSNYSVTVAAGGSPVWVKLVRSGANSNQFSAYYSRNGVTWTQLGTTQTVTMANSALVGLAVTSHANGTLCTSTFTGVVSYMKGDVNLDGHVNAADINVLMLALTAPATYQNNYHLSADETAMLADVNGDGVVNNSDLQYLLNLLLSGGGSLADNSASAPASVSSDISSVTNAVAFIPSSTPSGSSSVVKTIAAGSSSTIASVKTKKLSLTSVDSYFSRFDLRSFAKLTFHKHSVRHSQSDSLIEDLLCRKADS